MLGVYHGSLECLLDDGLEMLDLFGADQLGKQVCFGDALLAYVVQLKAFIDVNESFCGMVVP